MADKLAPFGVTGLIAGEDKRSRSAQPDIDKARRNVARMIDGGASEREIDSYLASEGLSAETLRSSSKVKADAKKFVGSTPAQLRVFNQGATFGFADEINAGGAALTAGANNALSKIGLTKGAGYNSRQAYDAVMEAEREANARFAQEHPVQNVALQIAGGIMAPGAKGGAKFIGKGRNLGQASLRSGAVGAMTGALYGAGTAEGGAANRAKGAMTGGATGAVVGAATPGAIRGAQFVGRRLGAGAVEAGSRVVQGLGMTSREPTAQQVARASTRATEYVGDMARKAPAGALSANPMEAAGKPILAAEALGRPGVTQLAAVARRAGQTPDTLESNLTQRAAAMPERIQSRLQDLTGITPEAVDGDFIAHAQQLRAKASPLYDVAYASNAPQNATLDRLLVRPSMRKAMSRAAVIAEEEGRDPTALGFDFNDAGDVIHVRKPSMQTLDYIKRGLDDVLEGYRDGTTGKLRLDEGGRAILGTLNEYRDTIAPAGSAYRAALDAGGEPLRQEEAFRLAPKLFNAAVSENAFARRFGGFTEAQREAFKGGFLNDVYEKLRVGRLRLKDVQTPAFASKVRLTLGDEVGQGFVDDVAQELQLAKTGGRMNPGLGSPTMELQAADAERAQVAEGLTGAARTLAQGRPVTAAAQAIASPIAGAYRGMQAPIDQATRDEVGRLLQLSPSELDAVLAAAQRPPVNYRASGRAVGPAVNLMTNQDRR